MSGPASAAAAPTVLTNSLRKRPRVFSSAIGALLIEFGGYLTNASGKSNGFRTKPSPRAGGWRIAEAEAPSTAAPRGGNRRAGAAPQAALRDREPGLAISSRDPYARHEY